LSTLETRCRLLLHAYSPEYRRDRGEEVLGTLLDVTPPDRTWPTLADATNLIAGGLRQRMALAFVPGLRAGLVVAGPVALAAVAGLSGYLLAGEALGPSQVFNYPGVGSFSTVGPVLYLALLLTTLAHLVLPRPDYRWVGVAAIVVGLVMIPVADLTAVARPSLRLLLPLLLLAVIGVAGTWHRPTNQERAAVVAGAALLATVTGWSGEFVYFGPGPVALAMVTAVAFAGTLVAGLVRAVLARGELRVLWAALILLVPASGPVATALGEGNILDSAEIRVRWLALQLAGLCIAGAAMRLTVARPGVGGRGSLRGVGTLALGFAAALCGFVWIVGETGLIPDTTNGWKHGQPFGPFVTLGPIAYTAWLAAALGWALLPVRWTRVLIAIAVAVTGALPVLSWYTDFIAPMDILITTLIPLGVVAFAAGSAPAVSARAGSAPAGSAAPAARPLRRLLLVVILSLGGLVLLARLFDFGNEFPNTLNVVTLGAVVPMGVAAVAAWQAVRAARGWGVVAPVVVLLVAAGWISMALLVITAEWQLLAVVTALLALALAAVITPSREPRQTLGGTT